MASAARSPMNSQRWDSAACWWRGARKHSALRELRDRYQTESRVLPTELADSRAATWMFDATSGLDVGQLVQNAISP
jgi:hypothetical protein